MWKSFLLILLIASFVVGVWFKDGNILGTAEDGVIFYNLSNYYHQAEYTWMAYPGLGSPSLTLIAGKPTFFILSSLQNLGIPGYLIQAGLIWFILVSSALGVYLLTRELFPKLPSKYILLSVFFYWFNPITLVDVWNRFLLNYVLFFALIPIISYLYIKGLRSGKYAWGILLSVVLLFYSHALSYIAFIILLWIWLFILTLSFVLINKSRKYIRFYISYFLISLILFAIINSWWILPLISLSLTGGSTTTTDLFVNQDNQNILKALSDKMGNLTDIFRLSNASFIDAGSLSWVKIYYSPILQILLYVITGAILYYLIKCKDDKLVLLLACLFFITIFLAKGSNPPFGEIYDLIFKHVPIFRVFRNPFEKFGYLLSVAASLLIGISIYNLESILKNKLRSAIYPFFFLVIFLVLGFPVYTSLAFTNRFPPTNDYAIGYKVQVPIYYSNVSKFLNDKEGNFRYLGFPIKDEGITYLWEKGFAGVELAVALYDSKGIFHNTSSPFFNKIVPEIEKNLLEDNLSAFANLLNVKYYVLRHDIDYKLRGMTDPAIIEQRLKGQEEKGEVKKVGEFGRISIWENLKWKDSAIYSARKFKPVDNIDSADNLKGIDVLAGEVLIDNDDLAKAERKVNQNTDNSVPDINYKKINPTKYILSIKDVKAPFLLVFSELYNGSWQAKYTDGQPITNHMRLNVYGNGWLVERAGDLDIEIEFAPQKWMDRGEVISIVSYIIICVYLLYLFLIKRKIT